MLIFAGVGPGQPELITLAAVQALQDADVIAFADSGRESVTERIVAQWIDGKHILRLRMPMKEDTAQWQAAHETAAQQLLDRLKQGHRITYPVLGDPSLYASSAYLLALINPHHPCQIIPGVPAMCAAAAAWQVPLALGREPLTVLPGFPEGSSLPQGNTLIMKAGRDLELIKKAARGRAGYIAKSLGMPEEFAGPLDDNTQHETSYFTTVLIKPGPG